VTRHVKSTAFTIERLACDCLDVRELRRKGLFGGDWVTFRPMLRWPIIAQLRVARYVILLELRDRPATHSSFLDQASSRGRETLDALSSLPEARSQAL
jgi:hypothetical protein